jgi:ligand-binding SRPBCC domain-containing protein
MKPFKLERKLFIPAEIHIVWKFFSDPHNLEKITPRDMKFDVIDCPDTDEIYTGMRIEYSVSPLLSIPLKWVTLIKAVNPFQSFTDTQAKGPYSLWEHTHTFEVKEKGVLMTDEVLYKLPLGPLGIIAHTLFVRKKLERIFDYREKIIKDVFQF